MASTGERWRVRVMAALVAAALLALGLPKLADAVAPPRTAESAIRSLSDTDLNQPETAALVLRAHARLGDTTRVHTLARRLERLAIRRGDSFGWGLVAPFDAYQDGSVNPASTIYTITTALVGLAFLDAYDVTGEPEFRRDAARAARTILERACCWRDGAAVWYSDQAQDQQGRGMVTPNVSGMSAALFLRLPGRRFHAAGHRLVAELLRSRDGMNWRYQYGAANPNDLGHLSFIIEGLGADPSTRALAFDVADAALARDFDSKLNPHDDYDTLGSQGAGPAGMLAALTHLHHPAAALLADSLSRYTSPWPDAMETLPRGRAWYGYALAD